MSDRPKAPPARGQYRPAKSVAPRRDPGRPKPPPSRPLVINFDPPRAQTVPLSAMKRATVCELAGHAWAWLNSGGQECARCGKPRR